jgi:pyrroline-5-carboxylate reductase
MEDTRIAILGAGNLGTSIANGLVESGRFSPKNITLTRRKTRLLGPLKKRGFVVQEDNSEAVKASGVVILAVEPRQIDGLLKEIGPHPAPANTSSSRPPPASA